MVDSPGGRNRLYLILHPTNPLNHVTSKSSMRMLKRNADNYRDEINDNEHSFGGAECFL